MIIKKQTHDQTTLHNKEIYFFNWPNKNYWKSFKNQFVFIAYGIILYNVYTSFVFL